MIPPRRCNDRFRNFQAPKPCQPPKTASISEPYRDAGALPRKLLATNAGDKFRRKNVKLLIGGDDNKRFALLRHEQRIVIRNAFSNLECGGSTALWMRLISRQRRLSEQVPLNH
jgi:hypothetical protein